jgi:glycerophosphoryl diester phosphodiesterase
MLKIGHRGAKAHIAENTLASFEEAFRRGANGIELDVHRCATGELVVIHDFTVDRTTDGSGEISKMSFNDLQKLVVEGQHQIPTLQEALDLVGPDRFINIEMKGQHTAKAVADVVEGYIAKGFSYDNIIVSSFQHEELEAMYATNKKIHLGVLTQASVAEALELAEKVKAKALHPHFSLLTERNVKKAQDAGYKIYTWTVNEPDDIVRMKSYGVDGIISDYPERL